MKSIIFMVGLFVLTTGAFSQYQLKNDQVQANAGFGFSSWGLPIYVGFDYGIHKDVSIGGEISYQSYKENWRGLNYSHSILGISGNCNYHFNSLLNIRPDWNFYAGLNIGFYNWSSPSGYGGSRTSGFGLGAQVGGRYYFSESFGVNLEFGGGNAFAGGKFGVSVIL